MKPRSRLCLSCSHALRRNPSTTGYWHIPDRPSVTQRAIHWFEPYEIMFAQPPRVPYWWRTHILTGPMPSLCGLSSRDLPPIQGPPVPLAEPRGTGFRVALEPPHQN